MKQIFDIPFKINQEVYFRNKEGIVDPRPFVLVRINIEVWLDKKLKMLYTVAPKGYLEFTHTLHGWGKESIFASKEEAEAYTADPDAGDDWL